MRKLLEPPKKGAPITRARVKNLSPKNAEKLLQTTNPLQMTRQSKPTRKNLKTKPKPLTIPTNPKKLNEKREEEENFFTDLSYPTGFIS